MICELFHYKLRFGNSRTLSERRRRHRSTNAKLFSFTSLAYSHLVYDVKPLLLVQGYVDRVVVDFSYFFLLVRCCCEKMRARVALLSSLACATFHSSTYFWAQRIFSAESTSVVNMLVLSISSSHLTPGSRAGPCLSLLQRGKKRQISRTSRRWRPHSLSII